MVTGYIVLKDSPARNLVDNAFRGKRDVRNSFSTFRATEGGNVAPVKDKKIGPCGHLEYILHPYVCDGPYPIQPL